MLSGSWIASAVSAGSIWKTPKPSCGIVVPSLSSMVGMLAIRDAYPIGEWASGQVRRMAVPAARPLSLRLECGQRFGAIRVNREDAIESGHLEQSELVGVGAHDREHAVVLAQTLARTDQNAQRGGVDERGVRDVDDDPRL